MFLGYLYQRKYLDINSLNICANKYAQICVFTIMCLNILANLKETQKKLISKKSLKNWSLIFKRQVVISDRIWPTCIFLGAWNYNMHNLGFEPTLSFLITSLYAWLAQTWVLDLGERHNLWFKVFQRIIGITTFKTKIFEGFASLATFVSKVSI